MKKTMIASGLITIIICLIFFIMIENTKSSLPKIEVKGISNWDFDQNNCTNKATIITATITFANLSNDPIVDLILANTYGNVKYNDIIIGRVSFRYPLTLGRELPEKRISLIPKNKEQDIFFIINNSNLTDAVFKHINNNHEKGNLTFLLELNFDINISFISPFFEKQTIVNSTVLIQTDILHTIDEKIYQSGIPQKYIPHDHLQKIFNFTIYKKKNNNIIYLNRTTILSLYKKGIPFIDINIGDNLEWYLPGESNKILKTYKEVIITSGFFGRFIFNNLISNNYNLTANKTPIGNIEIKNMEERNFDLRIRNSNYNFTITINLINFNKVIRDHIQNNETTIINISPDKDIFPPIEFNLTLSQLLDEIHPKMAIEWTEVKKVFTYIQFLLIGTIIGVTTTFLTNVYWKKRIKMLK